MLYLNGFYRLLNSKFAKVTRFLRFFSMLTKRSIKFVPENFKTSVIYKIEILGTTNRIKIISH